MKERTGLDICGVNIDPVIPIVSGLFVTKSQGMEHFMLDRPSGQATRIQGHVLHAPVDHSDVRIAAGLDGIRNSFRNGKRLEEEWDCQ